MRSSVNQERVRNWEAVAGASCFVAGLLAGLLGSVLTASGWFTGAELHPWIHAAGTAFLIVTIPLILLAGFCLDWSERRPNNSSGSDRDQRRGTTPPELVAVRTDQGLFEKVDVTQNEKMTLVQETCGPRKVATGVRQFVSTRGAISEFSKD